ncbi:hypothetical protein H0E87_003625 [Populus deltoides]|uniref:Uncharacterized protein n=1 Tax=Populus deltoides TaxID=3696 RepID=A0A8T2ZZS7_POPDE|nr:hypothetical protein H0E87_003625 [Populus deltoides]
MCSCNEALFMQSDYSSVRIWRFQPLHLQLAGMLKQMLGEIGRTWSSEGSWRRRHVINAGSFIFVPIIEWKRRACIVMPSSEDKSVTDTVNLYLHVLAVLVGPISLQEVKNNKCRIQAYRHWYCVQWNFKKNTHFLSKNYSFSSTSTTFSNTLLLKPSNSTLKASETESQTSIPAESNESEGEGKEKYEEYEVEIEQSYWLKFAKGRDGATYIDAIAPGGSADKTGKFSVGDKIWPASEYGRTMYTIRQRIGPLLMKMQKEIRNAKYEEALEKFESVLGSKPDLTEASVARYYVACCYLKLNQRIRADPDLENLRTSEEFEPLMKRFDESFINENAINTIKSLFGFNKK